MAHQTRPLVLVLLLIPIASCDSVDQPKDVFPTISTQVMFEDTVAPDARDPGGTAPTVAASTNSTPTIREPSNPSIQGRTLPSFDASPSDSTDEINCDEAETLAEEGVYEASDIADYCDYGPDNGEIDDTFQWEDDGRNP